jgi:hypothetical protein
MNDERPDASPNDPADHDATNIATPHAADAIDPRVTPQPTLRRGAVTVDELTADLVWPHLLRAIGYSAAPSRIALGTLAALWVFGGGALIDWLWREATDRPSAFSMLRPIWPTGGPADLIDRLSGVAVASGGAFGPRQYILVALWCLPVLGAVGVAIARPVALDFCASRSLGFGRSLSFAFRRWRSVLVFTLAPLLPVAVIVLLLWLAGLALFTTGVLSVVGGLLYGLAVLLGVAAAVVLLVYAVSFPMLPAGLAVESTDGIDAVQRGFSYVLNRTVRFVVYTALLAAVLFVAYAVVQFVLRTGWGLTADATGSIDRITARMIENDAKDTPFSFRVLGFWAQTMWLIFIGWVISYVFAAGTMQYLALRRANDEQDVREVWLGQSD